MAEYLEKKGPAPPGPFTFVRQLEQFPFKINRPDTRGVRTFRRRFRCEHGSESECQDRGSSASAELTMFDQY